MAVNLKDPRERPVDPERGKRLTQLEIMDVVRRHAVRDDDEPERMNAA